MTMEIDALHAGQPMRNSLDPCTSCADWQVLACQVNSLRAALMKVLDTREKEAKAHFAYQTAHDNYTSGAARESRRHLTAMRAASAAEKEARLLLATLKTPNVGIEPPYSVGSNDGLGPWLRNERN